MATTKAANRKDEVVTATKQAQVPTPASATVKRELLSDGSAAFSVHVSDWYFGERSVVFDATSEEHAVRLARAIDECVAWAIE